VDEQIDDKEDRKHPTKNGIGREDFIEKGLLPDFI